MTKALEQLTPQEVELMLKAPILVSILIAGADGRIDRKELQQATLTVAQTMHADSDVGIFVSHVLEDFEDKLKILQQTFASEPEKRAQQVSQELALLNEILPKISDTFAAPYYDMLRTLADKIARSSGGMFGLRTIAPEEARYVNLPMIHPPSLRNAG